MTRNLLCIDIGNTHVVIAVLKNTNVLDTIRIPSTPLLTVPDYIATIKGLLSKLNLKPGDIHGAIISSVVPRLTAPFQEVCKILSEREPLFL